MLNTDTELTLNTNENSVNFFVLADWGGLPVLHQALVQKSSARLMAKLAPKYNTKFQIGLGDNFYCNF